MTCQECKERMLPNDPSKPFYVGFSTRFKGVSPYSGCLPPLCNSCPNYPGLWNHAGLDYPLVSAPGASLNELAQLQRRVNYLQGKLEEHLEKPKIKRSSKYT